jgi:hypothetical protein
MQHHCVGVLSTQRLSTQKALPFLMTHLQFSTNFRAAKDNNTIDSIQLSVTLSQTQESPDASLGPARISRRGGKWKLPLHDLLHTIRMLLGSPGQVQFRDTAFPQPNDEYHSLAISSVNSSIRAET